MRKRIIEFMDMIVEVITDVIESIIDFCVLIISLLISIGLLILTPLWIVPYLIFKK